MIRYTISLILNSDEPENSIAGGWLLMVGAWQGAINGHASRKLPTINPEILALVGQDYMSVMAHPLISTMADEAKAKLQDSIDRHLRDMGLEPAKKGAAA